MAKTTDHIRLIDQALHEPRRTIPSKNLELGGFIDGRFWPFTKWRLIDIWENSLPQALFRVVVHCWQRCLRIDLRTVFYWEFWKVAQLIVGIKLDVCIFATVNSNVEIVDRQPTAIPSHPLACEDELFEIWRTVIWRPLIWWDDNINDASCASLIVHVIYRRISGCMDVSRVDSRVASPPSCRMLLVCGSCPVDVVVVGLVCGSAFYRGRR